MFNSRQAFFYKSGYYHPKSLLPTGAAAPNLNKMLLYQLWTPDGTPWRNLMTYLLLEFLELGWEMDWISGSHRLLPVRPLSAT